MPGEFSSPGQMKGRGPRQVALARWGNAGTQAEDALTMTAVPGRLRDGGRCGYPPFT